MKSSELARFVEALEFKTFAEQLQIVSEALDNQELKRKLQWLKNFLAVNVP